MALPHDAASSAFPCIDEHPANSRCSANQFETLSTGQCYTKNERKTNNIIEATNSMRPFTYDWLPPYCWAKWAVLKQNKEGKC